MEFWKNLIGDIVGMICVFMFPVLVILYAVAFGVLY